MATYASALAAVGTSTVPVPVPTTSTLGAACTNTPVADALVTVAVTVATFTTPDSVLVDHTPARVRDPPTRLLSKMPVHPDEAAAETRVTPAPEVSTT